MTRQADRRSGAGVDTVSLVLADPHPIVLAGMVHLFRKERGLRVVACCTTDGEAREAVVKHRPAILVLDLHLPRSGGLTLARDLTHRGSDAHVVLLADRVTDDEMLGALRCGVRGLVLKDMDPQRLVQCVRRVSLGEQWIENRSFGAAMDRLIRSDARMHELEQRLTRRELEILTLVADGLPNKEIHTRLDIAEGTVKIHMHNIYGKLGVKDRVQLALYARGAVDGIAGSDSNTVQLGKSPA